MNRGFSNSKLCLNSFNPPKNYWKNWETRGPPFFWGNPFLKIFPGAKNPWGL